MICSGLKNVFSSNLHIHRFIRPWNTSYMAMGAARLNSTHNRRQAGLHTDSGLPSNAEIVICGGGIIGCSVAYHLAKLGWNDIVLLEQGSLTCGTTWHAAGLVGKLRATSTETHLSDYGTNLYKNLEEETGLGTGFKTCGGLYLARTKQRMTLLKRNEAKCRVLGINAELVTPQRIQELWPVELKLDDLQGGLWLPEEGAANPTDVTQSLARGAVMNGVKIYEKVALNSVVTDGGAVQGVATDKGDINCRIFINCAGQWAREVGQKSNPTVTVPLHSCEHFYIVTKSIEGSHPLLPNIRDPDGHIYCREWSGGLMIGGFEPRAKPCFHDAIPPKYEYQLLPEDWDQFEILLKGILHRVPAIETAEIRHMTNGAESFTADGKYILGEAPEICNYYVAAGMCSSGIASAAGVGKALSEWITAGHPTMDLFSVDIKRFSPHENNKRFLRDRVVETLGWHYVFRLPYAESDMGRQLKCSPLYTQLSGAGAVWGQKMGWERANYFDVGEKAVFSNEAFGMPPFFRNIEIEAKACYENAALVDITGEGVLELTSTDENSAVDFLQLLCAKDVDVPVGHIVHTAMLNKEGGYEMDCTVARTNTNSYLIVVPIAYTTAAQFWISRHIPKDSSVRLRDSQSAYVLLGVLGPKSEDILQSLTNTPLDKAACPVDTVKTLDLGYAGEVIALRRTNISDLEQGWQLLIPTQFAVGLYNDIMAVGKPLGIRNAGCYTVDSLRIEKGYPRMGSEITPFINPFQAGLESSLDMDKDCDFIGKKALQDLKDKPIYKHLIFIALEDYDKNNIPWGGEPIFRDDKIVGVTSSTTMSLLLDTPVCMGYVTNDGEPVTKEYIQSGHFEIDVAGQRFPAKAALHKFTEQPTQAFLNTVFL